MILEYKGYNENWVYEEADIITYARVAIRDIVKKFKNNSELCHCYKMVTDHIKNETHCVDDITYLNGDRNIIDLDNVLVVMLDDMNKHRVYVFSYEQLVYLLNNEGKTIQKI